MFERVFSAMFGRPAGPAVPREDQQALPLRKENPPPIPGDVLIAAARAAKEHEGQLGGGQSLPPAVAAGAGASPVPAGEQDGAEPDAGVVAVRPVLAAAAERLAGKDFAELTPAESLMLCLAMRKLTLAVPLRRSRRHHPTPHGKRTDLRATLRQARRTGGDPYRLARRALSRQPRRLVVLCDISGSMEPYARAMLQLLYCAAGGARAEVLTFATRLTRLTTTLSRTRPELALQRAGETAPDWLGGTRIGASIKEFNDTRGRAGLARGAVVVIISDGWDTGDPAVLRSEMERLSRVAHRIVWVNPRTKSEQYQPLAGGMAAAWPIATPWSARTPCTRSANSPPPWPTPPGTGPSPGAPSAADVVPRVDPGGRDPPRRSWKRWAVALVGVPRLPRPAGAFLGSAGRSAWRGRLRAG